MDTSKLPKTRAEAKASGAKYYFTGEPCKHGHVSPRKTKGTCLTCAELEWKASQEKRKEYFKQYGESDAGQKAKREYYERNKDAVIARANARPLEDRRMHREKYKAQNPELYKAYTSVRRRRHKNATPAWITKEQKAKMRELYLLAMQLTRTTGEQYVVDHIVPLINPIVCGLHVPWNLRVITQEENLAKSNKF